MAIYRLEAKIVQRSTGRSVIAAAAYRAGQRLIDSRTGEIADYRRRSGVLYSEILAPPGAPDWAKDRQSLWSNVEAIEKRKDAQLAREVVVALPHELSTGARIELTRQFIRQQFIEKGMIADMAFHAPSNEGDQRNFHAHILLTLRSIDKDGFGLKERGWNDKELLTQWRESWALAVNVALKDAGIVGRVDHRSLKVQRSQASDSGDYHAAVTLDREPQIKLGPKVVALERRKRRTARQGHSKPVTDRGAALEHITLRNGVRRALGFGKLRLQEIAVRELRYQSRRLMRKLLAGFREALMETVEPPQRTR